MKNAIALAATVLLGCRAPNLLDPNAAGPVQYPLRCERESVTLSADPYVEPERVREVFGSLIADRGILPVRVRIENGSSQGVIVSSDGLELHRFDGTQVAQEQGVERRGFDVSDLIVSAWTAATMKRVEGTQANSRMSELSLRSTTLAPGASAEGFVYFGIPEDRGLPETLALVWTLPLPGSGSSIRLDLPLPSLSPDPIGVER